MSRIFLLLFLSYGALQAQQPNDTIAPAIKIDLVNFYDNFPAVLFSFEHPIAKKWALSHEGGPILPIGDAEGLDVKGFKLKEELRMYVESWGYTDFYMGFAVRFTKEKILDNTIVGYDCDGRNNCAYYQNFPGYFTKKLLSFEIRPGFRHNFSPFFIEYDLGYGYGKDFLYTPDNNLLDGMIISKNPFSNNIFNDGTGWKPRFSLRAKLGFKL